jgi:PAT family beta-lactamase induction signal transducer AmpG
MSRRRKLGWIAGLYFAEGLPFGIAKEVWPVYFRIHGVSLTDIGLMSLLGLPWTFKVLWSPLVDRYGERWQWIAGCLVALAALTLLTPLFDPSTMTMAFWCVLLAFTVASATQDIAIDAYAVGLVDRGEEGDANGVRVSAYRVALIASGGGMVVLSRWWPWWGLYAAAAVLFLLLALMVRHSPPLTRVPAAQREWWAPTKRWLLRPGVWAAVIFILTYKLGDAAMGPMVKPFWLERGLAPSEIGLVSTSAGIVATIAGALVGGRVTSRWGIFHGLWTLGLAQAVSNLGYATVAWLDPAAPVRTVASLGDLGAALQEPVRPLIYSASIIESFTGGLGTAALLAFLMNLCEKEHAAVQYALLSALFAFSRDVAGAASGWATTRLGFDSYFLLTFGLALPALALLPLVRGLIREADDVVTSDK